MSDTNYITKTPDRRKSTQAVHINLIKLYKTRNPAQDYPADFVRPTCSYAVVKTVDDFPCEHSTISNSNILANLEDYLSSLSPTQVQDVSTLIHKYSKVFGDYPQRCTLIAHDVQLIPGTVPIWQAP